MKMIKNKKVFGVLNVLDIAVIAVILVIVLPMLHYYMKFNEKGFAEQKRLERFIGQKMRNDIVNQTAWRTKTLDVDVSLKNLTGETLKKVKVGDRESQPDGTVTGEILWIGERRPNYFIVDVGTLNNSLFVRTLPDDSMYSLPAKIRLTGVVSDAGIFTYKDRTVRELSEFKFIIKEYEAYFVVEMPPLLGRDD